LLSNIVEAHPIFALRSKAK